MPQRTVVLAIALTLLVPLAAAAPLLYVGEGSGTSKRSHDTPLWPDCDVVHVEVVIHQVDGQWYPHSHREEFGDAAVCPEIGWHSVLTPGSAEHVEGTPEEGFRLSSGSGCSYSDLTIGPVGPASPWHLSIVNHCLNRQTWINATIAFGSVG